MAERKLLCVFCELEDKSKIKNVRGKITKDKFFTNVSQEELEKFVVLLKILKTTEYFLCYKIQHRLCSTDLVNHIICRNWKIFMLKSWVHLYQIHLRQCKRGEIWIYELLNFWTFGFYMYRAVAWSFCVMFSFQIFGPIQCYQRFILCPFILKRLLPSQTPCCGHVCMCKCREEFQNQLSPLFGTMRKTAVRF